MNDEQQADAVERVLAGEKRCPSCLDWFEHLFDQWGGLIFSTEFCVQCIMRLARETLEQHLDDEGRIVRPMPSTKPRMLDRFKAGISSIFG